MQSLLFHVRGILIFWCFYLFFSAHCSPLSDPCITFVPQIISENESSMIRGNQVNESMEWLNTRCEKPDRSLRFWALVVSFTEEKAEIETIENAGTETSSKREDLKIETYGKHVVAIVETNLEGITWQKKANVDVFKVPLESNRHAEFDIKMVMEDAEKMKRKRKRVGKMDKAPRVRKMLKWRHQNVKDAEFDIKKGIQQRKKKVEAKAELRNAKIAPWDDKDLGFLCRLPFLVDVVSANWLLGKKEAFKRSAFPRDRLKGEVEVREECVKCMKGCMHLLGQPQKLVKAVEEKVREIRTKTRAILQKALRGKSRYHELRCSCKANNHSEDETPLDSEDEVVDSSSDEESVSGKDEVCSAEDVHCGNEGMSGREEWKPYGTYKRRIQMDDDKEWRELPTIFPSDIGKEWKKNKWEKWERWKKKGYTTDLRASDDAASEKWAKWDSVLQESNAKIDMEMQQCVLRNLCGRLIRTLQQIPSRYESCDIPGPPKDSHMAAAFGNIG